MLLRAEYPAADGFGRDDRLRLMINDPETGKTVAMSDAAPMSDEIELQFDGIELECERVDTFAPLSGR